MTDAENMLWLKLRRKQWKGHPFYRQKIIGKYIVDFYPVRNNAPLEFLTGFTKDTPCQTRYSNIPKCQIMLTYVKSC